MAENAEALLYLEDEERWKFLRGLGLENHVIALVEAPNLVDRTADERAELYDQIGLTEKEKGEFNKLIDAPIDNLIANPEDPKNRLNLNNRQTLQQLIDEEWGGSPKLIYSSVVKGVVK